MSKAIHQYNKEGEYQQYWPSISDAARSFRVDESSIRKACDARMCCGYYWSENERKNYFKSTERLSEIDILKNEISELKKKLVVKEPTEKLNNRYITNRYNHTSHNGNVLTIGDLHLPFTIDGYLEFCIETQKKYNCKDVVFIGDIVDLCANSRWAHDPDGMSSSDEYKSTLKQIKKWYEAFPKATIVFGNHDTRIFKQAFIAGIPKGWVKSMEEMYQMPDGWKCTEQIEIDDVMYSHGDGCNGDMGALNKAKEKRQSVVIGHGHSFAGVRYLSSHKDTIFGMNVGCGVEEESYALAYAKFQDRRPVISCGVVLEFGKQPLVIKM
jgi:metallophosphoesterase superfamily enzyme